MRATVIKTAVKMPFYSISYSSSSYSASSSVFRDTEKLSCANEVSASKQASKQASKPLFINKGLLQFARTLFGFPFFEDSFIIIEPLSFYAAKSGCSGLSRHFYVDTHKEEL